VNSLVVLGAIHTNLWYDFLENENPTLMGTDKTVQQKLETVRVSSFVNVYHCARVTGR
jgi:hypothetical protein